MLLAGSRTIDWLIDYKLPFPQNQRHDHSKPAAQYPVFDFHCGKLLASN